MTMKHSVKYIAFITLPFLAACNEVEEPELIIDADNRIVITSGYEDPLTRTLLHPSDINQSGTTLTLYGTAATPNGASEPVFNGFEAKYPDINDPTGGNASGSATFVRMINWEIFDKTSTTPDDPIVTPKWDNTKNYTFYSWLAKDKYGKTPDGTGGFFTTTGFSYNKPASGGPAKLEIGTKPMPLDDSGFDFCYTDVVTRTANTANPAQFDASPVNLVFKHLFTSFCLGAHNYTSKPIVINSVKLYGLKDKKSAVIAFDDESGTKVSFDNVSSSYTSGTHLLESSVTLSTSAPHMANIIGGSSATDAKYILMWPQTTTELASDLTTSPKTGAYLEISYTKDGSVQPTAYLELPYEGTYGWEAGACQNMELSFTEYSVQLSLSVEPWNYIENSYDYTAAPTATAGGKLKMSNTSSSAPKDAVADATPVKITFTLDSPMGATWLASVTNTDAFEIYTLDGTGSENPAYGVIQNSNIGTPEECVFYVKKKTGIVRDAVLTTKVHVTVRTVDGTYINIDDILDAADWTIILNPLS